MSASDCTHITIPTEAAMTLMRLTRRPLTAEEVEEARVAHAQVKPCVLGATHEGTVHRAADGTEWDSAADEEAPW